MQREQQDKLLDELFSPISGATLPASIEERLELYTKRMELEERNIPYKIVKHKFLNYRQFSFRLLKGKQEPLVAYALFYSTLPRKKTQGRIEYEKEGIYHLNRDEVRFIDLQKYNLLANTSYANIYELLYNPPSYKTEQHVRYAITQEPYDLTPIIVTDLSRIVDAKLTVELDAKTYEDTKEKLIEL